MRQRSKRTERGAVAIIVALSMVAVVIAAALVVDFGLARLDRQTNKAASDAAATTGMASAAEDMEQLKPWAGVCAAVSTLKANVRTLGAGSPTETWTRGDGTGAGSNPCADMTLLQTTCVPDTPSSWAVYRASVGSDYQVEVKSGYKVTDGGFPAESYASLANDPGNTAKGGCDQLAVIISQARKPGLGSLASSSDLVTTVRSVARLEFRDKGKAPVALLILEQHDCSVINTDGSTTRLWVHGSDIVPGMMHSDSLGDTPGNTGGCQSSKIVGGTGQVKAFAAPSGGAPGVIGIRALLPGEGGNVPAAFDASPAVVAEGQPAERPEGRPLVTRAPVDERYLAPVTAKVNTVWPMFAWSKTQAEAQGYTWMTPANCNGSGITGTFPGKVYVNCPGGAVFGTSTFNGSSVIVNGPVTVKSGETLALPNATAFYIRGTTGGGANDNGLDVAGRLRVHDATDQTCANADSATSGRAEIVLGGGRVNATNSSSLIRMCHTTMITMGNLPGMPSYANPAPAPTNNARNGNLNITGGSQDWTAPNAKPGEPSGASDWANFEDLAFWTETSNESRVGGGGFMHLSGVFMLPNANPFTIGGSGTQDVENCQYVARKLHAHGGGKLDMSPDPNDVIRVEYFGDVVLVR